RATAFGRLAVIETRGRGVLFFESAGVANGAARQFTCPDRRWTRRLDGVGPLREAFDLLAVAGLGTLLKNVAGQGRRLRQADAARGNEEHRHDSHPWQHE